MTQRRCTSRQPTFTYQCGIVEAYRNRIAGRAMPTPSRYTFLTPERQKANCLAVVLDGVVAAVVAGMVIHPGHSRAPFRSGVSRWKWSRRRRVAVQPAAIGLRTTGELCTSDV